MSDLLNGAVDALNNRMKGRGFDGVAKFVIDGEGSIIIDDDGARISDDEADVTLSASADVFQSIMDGDTAPTGAFMSGKLRVDGDMGMAMKLSGVLS